MIRKIFLRFNLFLKKLFKKNLTSYEFTTSMLFYNVLNKNERIYLKDSIDVDELNERANRMPMYGQMNHPDTYLGSLKDSTHIFDKFFIEDDVLYGHGRTLKTENGSLLIEMLKNNQIVFRPRSVGHVNSDNKVSIDKVYAFDAILTSNDAFEGNDYLTLKKL